jgi:hypothetical protein
MEKDQNTYLKEIEAIQQTLVTQEGMQLLEPWAFYTWAAITAAGTVISLLFQHSPGIPEINLLLAVWIPAILIGGTLELIGWIRVIKRKERVLFTDRMQRMQLTFIGMITAFSFIGFGLALKGIDISGLIVLLMSVCFMVIAVFSWKELFVVAYLLLAAGIAIFMLSGGGTVSYIAASVIIAGGFVAGGVISSHKEKSGNE